MSTITTQTKSLIDSAMDLFLKYGIKSVSMDDLAQRLGISKKTIYNLVNNKDSLVVSVVGTFIKREERLISKIIKSSDNAIDEMFCIARHVQKTIKSIKPSLAYDLKKYHPKAWAKIEGKHYKFIEETISNNIVRGIKNGFYREDLDAKIIAKLYISISTLISSEEVFKERDYNMSVIYQHVIMYHLNGIINNKGKKEMSKYLKSNLA